MPTVIKTKYSIGDECYCLDVDYQPVKIEITGITTYLDKNKYLEIEYNVKNVDELFEDRYAQEELLPNLNALKEYLREQARKNYEQDLKEIEALKL